MISLFRFVSVSVGLTVLAAAQEALPMNERVWLAGKIYSSTMQYFAHWQDVPELDADAAYRKYIDQILSSGDRRSFARATMEFLAAFRNSHTTLIDHALTRTYGALPFTARHIAGQWIILESWIAGLKSGDVIESIDGEAFEEFFARHRRFIPASTEGWARHALFARLGGMAPYAHLLPDRFVLGLDGGRKVSVDRASVIAKALPTTDGRWLEPGKVAYIRIPSFFSPEFEKRALELLNEFRNAKALIVDVRGNTGGNTPGKLTSELMDRTYRWWTESTPVALPYFRFRAGQGAWELEPFSRPELLWRNRPRQPAKDAFSGKLALLIDTACHSACEDFVMPFKDNRRATLFGEQTAGSTGQPYLLEPGHDMLVLIGAKREMFPDGSQFESVGIQPDVVVTPSLNDIRQSRDVVLEAARKFLGVF